MHHIDRTLQELETGSDINGEYESEFEYNANDEFGQAFGQEATYSTNETFEMGQDPELEMAYQLLEVSDEYELNQFLGSLMSKALGAAKSAAGSFINSSAGKGVGQYLVNIGKQTLPKLATQYGGQAGSALGQRIGGALGSKAGNWVGKKAGNWVGSKVGNAVASKAQRIFNLELEALEPEDQELEIARSYVRFANDLTRRASQVARQNPQISLSSLGKQVIPSSASQHAPGLLKGSRYVAQGYSNGYAGTNRRTQGTWVRRGNTIVLYGA